MSNHSSPSPNLLSAAAAARAIAAGALSSEALVGACLERIGAREPVVQAWAHVDKDAVLDQARQLDRTPNTGPLHGVPFGVKDIIDVAGMPCGMGSPIYNNHVSLGDAACVAACRAAGGIPLGKTVTAEFAATTPGPTTNPLDPTRTPGGSSSGSAAAVADGMVPVAFGTQTGGSVLRPASYCGVIGFKPTFGAFNREGIKFAAESVDTIGIIARDLEDVNFFWRVLTGDHGEIDPASRPPRLAVCRGWPWSNASEDSIAALDNAAATAKASGATLVPFDIPDECEALRTCRVNINGYERSRALAWEWRNNRDQISPGLQRTLSAGWDLPAAEYWQSLQVADDWRRWLDDALSEASGSSPGGIDAIITPAVNGVADAGLGSTGDPGFQEIWTLLHAPAITLPLHNAAGGLPVGVQLVAARHRDRQLLQVAAWLMAAHPS